MIRPMTAAKVAISLDEQLLEEIRACTQASGQSLSGWLSDAARRKLRAAAAHAALESYEAEFGEIGEAEVEAVRLRWQG